MGDEARIRVVRRVEWSDTDAAGVMHWGAAFRMVEAAEGLLHERLGIRERTFGSTPRVHVETSYRRELHFFQRVEVDLRVVAVGRTSLRYGFTLRPEGEEEPAAEGELVIVHVSGQPAGEPEPWPGELRERLEHGGDLGVGEAP